MKKIQMSILLLFIVIAVVLSIIKITISTLSTTAGSEYSQIDAQRQQLEKDNTILREKILTDASFYAITSKAEKLGLIYDNKSRLTFSDPAPFAYKQ